MSVGFFYGVLVIAVGGFTIAMMFKQKSRTFIFGGSAVIGFVLTAILDDASRGFGGALIALLFSFAIQKVINKTEAGKNLRERISEASGFSKTPAQFVEKYNSEVDDYVEIVTEPEEGSHRKRKQVDCSALKIVKTVEQTPDSGYFQLQDAPYIKIHWIKGQYDEQLKGVAFAFAMKTVQQDGANFDAATLWPEIRYGKEEDEIISISSAVIKSMIHALYDYSRTGAKLAIVVSTLATNSIGPEDLGWTKVWKFHGEVTGYASQALAKVNIETRERLLSALEAAQNKNKAAQENPETFSAENREEFEFEGVSFVVIVSNQLSSKELESESKSNVWIVATKDAGIERRLENEIIGR